MRKTLLLGSGFLLIALTSCNQAPDPRLKTALVGRWEEIGGNRNVEFTESGQLTLDLKGVTFPYKYEWIGPKQVEWKENGTEGGWPGGRATISIDDDVLTLDIRPIGGVGYVSKFKRVK